MALTVGGSNVVPMANRRAFSLYDSFTNFLAGLGVVGRDKAASQEFSLNVLSQEDVEKAFRGDWLARKIVEIPAFDACRAWRSWEASQDQITKIEDVERKFAIQLKVMDAMVKARLYGGSAIVMGIKGQDFKRELDLDSVDKDSLAFVHVVSRWMISPGPVVRDITSPWFGEPEYYQRSNTPISPQVGGVEALDPGEFSKEAGSMIMIHPSRVVRMLGNPYPNMEIGPDAWGDSVLQTVVDAIKDAGLVGQSIAALTAKANVDVIQIPGLTQMLSTTKGTAALVERFSASNVAKSVVNSLLIDKNEDWKQLQVTFSGLPQVFQMYLMVACGAGDIPATRLLGKSPDGQNSTGDSDLRNYYDKLQADQKVRGTPTLSRLDEVLIRSALGSRPKEIHYDWNPLWQMDGTQVADIALKKAQAFKIDNDSALFDPVVMKKARENQLIEDGTYPGLETTMEDFDDNPDDVPEPALGSGAAPANDDDAPPDDDDGGSEEKTGTRDDITGGGQSALGFVTPGGEQLKKKKRRDAAAAPTE